MSHVNKKRKESRGTFFSGYSLFKSIRWRILSIFVLLIVALMLFVGTLLLSNISNFYLNMFKNDMSTRVFTPQVISDLEVLCADKATSFEEIIKVLDAFSGRLLGIGSNRSYYILDGKTGSTLYSSNDDTTEITSNILRALSGEKGDMVYPQQHIMDYAVGLKYNNSVEYVIYVKDNKRDLEDIISNLYIVMLSTLALAATVFVAFGIFLSYTITVPIASLRTSAERLASGDFDYKVPGNLPRDEIGALASAFNKMAKELKETLLKNYSERIKLETILKYQADGIVAFDEQGNIIHINPIAQKMLSCTEESTFGEVFRKQEVDLLDLLYLEQFSTSERIINLNGVHIKSIFAPFRTEDGNVGGVVVVLSDITEQQKLEMSRREFVANVSHELRTPLTTIKSYTETLLESGGMDDLFQRFLSIILNETDRMTRIVKDLLTLSKLDYDKDRKNDDAFRIEVLLEEVVQKLSVAAVAQGVTLHYSYHGEPVAFWGERDRIEQVFTNIISNAYKYTQAGGKVEIACKFTLTQAIIAVKDTGIGIPQQDLPRIFERFYRVDKARSREHGGTGLGLAIAKEIVQMHNGKIEISSAVGVGTTVTIKFPLFRA